MMRRTDDHHGEVGTTLGNDFVSLLERKRRRTQHGLFNV